MVIQLIKKDFTYLLTSLKSTLALLVIFSLFMSMANIGGGCVMPALVSYLFFFYMLVYEERNKSDLLNLVLPINREDICLSKYIQVVVVIIISSILAILGIILKNYISTNESIFYIIQIKELILTILSTALIYNAIIMPCVFYFGTLKSRYVVMIIYGGVFGMASHLGSVDLESIISSIQNRVGNNAGIISILLAGVLFIISYFISRMIWEHKEF